jgi:histidyl-tRNA synthetase
MGEKASQLSMRWLTKLRMLGFRVDRDFLNRSIKAQMRDAHRQKTRVVLIIGDNEIEKKSFGVKDMDSGQQSDIPFQNIEKYLDKLLKSR